MPDSAKSDQAARTAAARAASVEAFRRRREQDAEATIHVVEKLVRGLPPLPPELRQRISVLLSDGDG
jgi:NADH dehydrogenase FAD-containing subunit